jgi:uncharacterized cupin superfamily protein
MAVGVANLAELALREWETGVRFGAEWGDISRPLGGKKLGCGLWVLPPGKANVPYHYHLVNEELAVVLGGEPSIRLNNVEYQLKAGDVVALPPGADSAHQILNRTDRSANLLMASTLLTRDVAVYPDSDKRLYWVDDLAAEESKAKVLIRDGKVLEGPDFGPYFEGEPVDEPLPDAIMAQTPHPNIVSIDIMSWESYEAGPFRGDRKRVGRTIGAKRLGYSLYRLAAGDRMWPFHFHHVNEEFFWIRSGYGELRTVAGARDIKPGDVVLCPTGADGAHAIKNTGDAPLEIFTLSTMEEPEVAEYPDSEKVYIMSGSAPGGDEAVRTLNHVFRRSDAVEYDVGER